MPAKITRISPFTDIPHTMQFDLYEQQEFEVRLLAWQSGRCLLEDAFPELSSAAIQFIRNGITEDEWRKYMGGDC